MATEPVTLTGRIEITPPLILAEFLHSPLYTPNHRLEAYQDTILRCQRESVDVKDGVLHRVTADAIVPNDLRELLYGKSALEEIRTLIDACPGHAFHGALYLRGQDPTELARIVVSAREAVCEKALISWPSEARA